MPHDARCTCSHCRQIAAASVALAQADFDLVGDEWAKWIGDGQERYIRLGDAGSPGSIRWTILQVAARARVAS